MNSLIPAVLTCMALAAPGPSAPSLETVMAEAIPGYLKQLREGTAQERLGAIRPLLQLPVKPAQVIPLLVPLLDDDATMIPAAWAMSCFDPIQTPLTLRALQIAIQSENHCKRLLAIEHLRLLGPAAIELLPVLQKFADDPEEVLELRVASIEAIGEIGRDESRLSPWLLQLLISENLDVAVAVAPILEARGYSARAVLPALRRAIARASSKYQRWLLIRTIIRIDPAEIPRFVPLSDDSGLDYDGPLWAFGTLRLSPFRRPILDHLRKAAHTRADFWVHLTPIAFGPRQPGEHTLGEDSLFDTSVELLRELKPPARQDDSDFDSLSSQWQLPGPSPGVSRGVWRETLSQSRLFLAAAVESRQYPNSVSSLLLPVRSGVTYCDEVPTLDGGVLPRTGTAQ